jgi:ferredoxin
MRVVVDPERCESHGLCMAVAPEVFELDDTDDLHILVDEVPEHLQAKVERAIANCPKQALSAL